MALLRPLPQPYCCLKLCACGNKSRLETVTSLSSPQTSRWSGSLIHEASSHMYINRMPSSKWESSEGGDNLFDSLHSCLSCAEEFVREDGRKGWEDFPAFQIPSIDFGDSDMISSRTSLRNMSTTSDTSLPREGRTRGDGCEEPADVPTRRHPSNTNNSFVDLQTQSIAFRRCGSGRSSRARYADQMEDGQSHNPRPSLSPRKKRLLSRRLKRMNRHLQQNGVSSLQLQTLALL